MTYPLVFREKVFATKDKFDLTFEETSQRFDSPIRTLFRWQKKLKPCTIRNKPVTKIDIGALVRDIQESPDDSQWERSQRLGVTQQAVGLALKRLSITVKKSAATPQV